MRKILTAVTVVAATITTTTSTSIAATSTPTHQAIVTYTTLWNAVHSHVSRRAPGRNIARYGVMTHRHVHRASAADISRSTAILRRLLNPPPPTPRVITAPRRIVPSAQAVPSNSVPGTVYHAPVSTPPVSHSVTVTPSRSAPSGTLARIAQCESGGNPHAISPGGQYRGKYQFDYGTWASVGGHGDPAAASVAEQDQRAAALYAQRGSAPWPVCGR